jgi:hypothetical protein
VFKLFSRGNQDLLTLRKEMLNMNPSNPVTILKTAVGVGGSVLAAPVAMPVLHGLAGIAVVGVSIFAVGSLVVKTAGAIKGAGNPLFQRGRAVDNDFRPEQTVS